MQLTLITPYRDRAAHLISQLTWWAQSGLQASVEWIVVEVTAEPSVSLQNSLTSKGVGYIHLACDGDFHKTKALNLGLALAQGALVAAFDVDLIPLGDTLRRHCWLALRSPHLLVTGYRLMAQTETVDMENLAAAVDAASLGPEDQPTALRKYLLAGERFGVMPLFWRDRLLSIRGWDETYVGWGAEDQDLIERYLIQAASGSALCRCHELTYLHLKHGSAIGWNDATMTQKNRKYYYATQSRRKNNDFGSI